MTSRGPGRASRTREMDEKEQLRRQIRLLQGLIDDYKNLHGNAPATGTSAAPRWQPPAYHGDRAFGTRYPRPSRRDFTHQGPSWRKKYSLVNWPPGSSDPPGDRDVQTTLGAGARPDPEPQQEDVLERQVQLGSDHNMVIKIKPPSKAGCAGAPVPLQSSVGDEDAPWGAQQPREGEGEPPGGQLQPCRPARGRGGRSVEDPLLVCQKEPGRPRVVRSVGSVTSSAPGPRRTVSESAVAIKPHAPAPGLGRTGAPHSAASCAAQLPGHGRVRDGHPAQPVPSGSTVGPARPASGARQAREASLLVPCRTSKFRKNNYKWVAASAKSPRATRRALSPRAAAENLGKAPCGTAATETAQLRADQAKARRPGAASKPGPSPSKYKWKAASPSASSSSSSSRWQAEAGGRDHAPLLAPVPSRSPPGETSLSAYKVKSRTKIIRRRSGTSLPGDKKSSPSAVGTKTPVSLRRRQAVRGRSTPVLKKTPHRGLLQITRHRLCGLPTREACGLHPLRTPPTSKVIKTRYRIVKKTPTTCPSALPCPSSPPSWRARRLSQSRALALNRVRPTAAGPARWGNKGYCCIGGVLYKVSANKLSKTSGRPGDAGGRPLLRPGRLDPPSSCSRSLASRAVQRSLAIIRQAKQKKEKKKEYCMYYNRFGRCNRGEHCPYIHDPEKVAVCTRFVRGTCKKTDGTCPFSHQVSKEKMPVCSYFLKGVCSHSSCPYSHVYVSRKAEVCSDFLKGYCPLGAKCKKKHTLLCPDFARRGACPRGTQCQLLHRNKKRHGRRTAPPTPGPGDTTPRSRPSAGHGPRKPSASQRPPTQTSGSAATAAPASPPPTPRKSASAFPSTSSPKASSPSSSPSSSSSSSPSSSPSPSPSPSSSAQEDPHLQEVAAPVSSSSGGLCKLPSFISLQSSPSPGGQPRARTPRSPRSKDSGRPLHIKPRL